MDNKLYLIHLDDYLSHIDDKLEMYDLLLELVDALRKDLAEGETAQAVRTLCAYEQQAHLTFECWDIPDAYVENLGDTDYLSGLMERELLPAWDEDYGMEEYTGTEEESGTEDDGMEDDSSATVRLLRAVGQVNRGTAQILEVIKAMAAFEAEISRIPEDCEPPENACAE